MSEGYSPQRTAEAQETAYAGRAYRRIELHDAPFSVNAEVTPPYDYKTPAYEVYARTHIAYLRGEASRDADSTAFAAAQQAAAQYAAR